MNRIKELREKMGYTQSKLAVALGVAQSSLSGWETDKYPPDYSVLRKMSSLFGCPIEQIYGESIEAIDRPIDNGPIMQQPITGRESILTDEAYQLAIKFQLLNPSARAVIKTIAEFELRQDTYMNTEINKLQAELDAQKQLHDAEMETARLQIARLAADIEAAHAAEQKEEA